MVLTRAGRKKILTFALLDRLLNLGELKQCEIERRVLKDKLASNCGPGCDVAEGCDFGRSISLLTKCVFTLLSEITQRKASGLSGVLHLWEHSIEEEAGDFLGPFQLEQRE